MWWMSVLNWHPCRAAITKQDRASCSIKKGVDDALVFCSDLSFSAICLFQQEVRQALSAEFSRSLYPIVAQ